MYSFYGGQQGRTYHIVKTYPSIEAMNTDFESPNTEVMYHQYVLIDTTMVDGENNPLGNGIDDPDNGKLYRRGFDEAIYVGNIRGSTGNTADIIFTNATNVFTNTENTSTYEAQTHQASVNGDSLKSTYEILPSLSGGHTTFAISLDSPIPRFNTTISSKEYTEDPDSAITAIQNKPYNYNATFGIPNGVPGSKITNATVINTNASNQQIQFNGTSYSKDDINTTGSSYSFSVPYRTITSVEANPNNNNLIVNYAGTIGDLPLQQEIGPLTYTAKVQGIFTQLPVSSQEGLIILEKDNQHLVYIWDEYANPPKWKQVQNLSQTVQPNKVITDIYWPQSPDSINVTTSEQSAYNLLENGFAINKSAFNPEEFGTTTGIAL